MMTVYTAINVPYGAMLGVMTADPQEKTVFSSFRMFFAYGGSFIALAAWEPLVNFFKTLSPFPRDGEGLASLESCSQQVGGGVVAGAWQHAMMIIAAACLVLFILTFLLTRERLKTVSTVSVGKDFLSLLSNRPWWLLIGAALCFNLFCTVRGATVAYYFADVIGFDASLNINLSTLNVQLLFYAGLFLSIGEVANMIGVACTVPLARRFGKKSLFMGVNVTLVVLSIAFFFIPVSSVGFWLMLLAQVLISMLTGVISPLIWSMYADVSDYAELRYHTASTGLIFSSSSMAQKFGGAIGGAVVLWLLSACGYVPRTDEQLAAQAVITQPETALQCLRYLMSFIPAAVALIAVIVCHFYPLTTARVREMNEQLRCLREPR